MRRDDDLIRNMLLEYEAAEDWLIVEGNYLGMPKNERKRQGHVLLLSDAGLLTNVAKDTYRLTNSGHDLLASIRDEGIWAETKRRVAETGGNATLDIVKALATGFLKKKIAEQTGIDL